MARRSSDAGKRPRGWLGPGLTETWETPDILVEEGYEYVADWVLDDQPVWLKTRGKPIESVPYTQECNDVAMMLIQHHKASEFLERAIDQFEQIYADAEGSARVMAISMHPYIMGAPHRTKYFRRIFETIRLPFWGNQVTFPALARMITWRKHMSRQLLTSALTAVFLSAAAANTLAAGGAGGAGSAAAGGAGGAATGGAATGGAAPGGAAGSRGGVGNLSGATGTPTTPTAPGAPGSSPGTLTWLDAGHPRDREPAKLRRCGRDRGNFAFDSGLRRGRAKSFVDAKLTHSIIKEQTIISARGLRDRRTLPVWVLTAVAPETRPVFYRRQQDLPRALRGAFCSRSRGYSYLRTSITIFS
jgi:hypothetical protein